LDENDEKGFANVFPKLEQSLIWIWCLCFAEKSIIL